MAVLRLAVDAERVLHIRQTFGEDAPEIGVADMRRAAPRLPETAPIVILLHGYMFDPFTDAHYNPHRYLFHFDDSLADTDRLRRPMSWPKGLGFSEDDVSGRDGLCVAFGWRARGLSEYSFSLGPGRFCAAFEEALRAGKALARTVLMLRMAFPGRRIDIFAHSLGARVAFAGLSALGPCAAVAIRRMILLYPADFAAHARRVIDRVDQALPEIYALNARENGFFDRLLERFAPADPDANGSRRALGLACPGMDHPNWIDLRLDSAALLDAVQRRGIELDASPRAACHWGAYNRNGAMAMHSAILRAPDGWAVQELRSEIDRPDAVAQPGRGWLPRLGRPSGQRVADTRMSAM